MILEISQRFGLASFGGRYLLAADEKRHGGLVVQEFTELTSPHFRDDARLMLDSPAADTKRIVIESREVTRTLPRLGGPNCEVCPPEVQAVCECW